MLIQGRRHRRLELAQFLATLCCTLFAGAAVCINLVEHPARTGCDTKIAVTVWVPSYKRATVMQALLAVVSFLAGVLAWIFETERHVARWRSAHWPGSPVYLHCDNADEPPAAGARARFDVRGNTQPVGEMGKAARGTWRPEFGGFSGLYCSAARGLTTRYLGCLRCLATASSPICLPIAVPTSVELR
jgi:hypothetical protein